MRQLQTEDTDSDDDPNIFKISKPDLNVRLQFFSSSIYSTQPDIIDAGDAPALHLKTSIPLMALILPATNF